jgi:signal transduction histidine kinase/DNA-binding response OmpR family regulator
MNAPALTILVVEDENIVALDLRTTLIRLGYEVVDAVRTGREAIERVEQRRPDLVLMDIQLRGEMDGIEAAERIRRLDVPVVYLTAFSDDATLGRARETQPLGYLLKPFDDRELQIVIELAIHRHRAQKEHDQLLREQAARAAIEKEHRWTRFLADASRELSASLDVSVTLQTVARLAVPDLADWAALHVRGKQGLEMAAIHHAHDREEAVRDLLRRYPLPPDAAHAYPRVMRTGEPELIEAISDEVLASVARDAENLRLLRSLGLKGQICVPLIIRGETRAALTLAIAESDRRYGPDDLAHAMEVASRCAMAMENAELFQQAQEAIGLRDEFLSIASHELRTPLSTLQLLVQSIERAARKLDAGDIAPKIGRILRQVERLTGLVKSLLDVTRIGEGQLELEVEELDFVPAIREIVERFAEPAQTAGSRLELSLPERLIGSADPLRLDQILTNLLSNAIKFGAGKPIEITLQGSPSQLRLTVRDRGIGIPEGDKARIFERFVRAVSSRQYGGLGLGLYITRRLVEAHGGTVQVESAPGAGAIFTVDLPRPAPQGRAADT